MTWDSCRYHRLDEPGLDTLHYHINEAEFSVGDFALDYRVHYRVGRDFEPRNLRGSCSVAALDESIGTTATPEPNLTQSIYFFIAREYLLVRRDHHCQFFDELDQLPKVGSR